MFDNIKVEVVKLAQSIKKKPLDEQNEIIGRFIIENEQFFNKIADSFIVSYKKTDAGTIKKVVHTVFTKLVKEYANGKNKIEKEFSFEIVLRYACTNNIKKVILSEGESTKTDKISIDKSNLTVELNYNQPYSEIDTTLVISQSENKAVYQYLISWAKAFSNKNVIKVATTWLSPALNTNEPLLCLNEIVRILKMDRATVIQIIEELKTRALAEFNKNYLT
jgi:hypothetical protein